MFRVEQLVANVLYDDLSLIHGALRFYPWDRYSYPEIPHGRFGLEFDNGTETKRPVIYLPDNLAGCFASVMDISVDDNANKYGLSSSHFELYCALMTQDKYPSGGKIGGHTTNFPQAVRVEIDRHVRFARKSQAAYPAIATRAALMTWEIFSLVVMWVLGGEDSPDGGCSVLHDCLYLAMNDAVDLSALVKRQDQALVHIRSLEE